MGAWRASAVAMKARATKESSDVSRERQARPWPQRLDQVIHDRTRLAILAALAASETLSFTDLKTITGTTDGNLSVHARRLEDAGYVLCEKTFAGRTRGRNTGERGRAAGVREVSRPHGRAHQGDAEEVDRPGRCDDDRRSRRSRKAKADQPVCANGVAMSRSAAPNTGQLNAVGST